MTEPRPNGDGRSGRWRRPGRLLRDLNQLALLLVIAAGAALLLVPSSDDGLTGLPELQVGDVSPRTIKSPQAFVIDDPDATEQIRKQRVANLLPTYDLHTGMGSQTKVRLEAAFGVVAEKPSLEEEVAPEDRSNAFMQAIGVGLEPEVMAPLFKAEGDELRDAAIMVAQTVYEARIVEDKALILLLAPRGVEVRLLDPDGQVLREESVYDASAALGLDQARARIDELAAEQLKRFPSDQRRAIATLLKRSLKPNLVANEPESVRRRVEAVSSVKARSIQVSPGETVLRAGEKVTKQHLSILSGIDRELRAQSRMQGAAGGALLVVVLIVFGYRFASRSYRPGRPSHRDLAFLAAAYLLTLCLLWVGYKGTLYLAEVFPILSAEAFRYLLPVAAGALVVRIVAGAEAAIALTVVTAVTAGWMMDQSLPYGVYALAGGLAAGSVERARPRAALFSAMFRAMFAQIGVVLAIGLLGSSFTGEDALEEVLTAAGSALGAGLFASLLLPVVEVLFGYTTSFKLTDLANLNHPLLRELLVEAPGTYHHSIWVGTLAEAGARAIGANTLLAMVGGYYHDIGKLKAPRAFEENDPAALLAANPADAARELRAHVAEGLERAAQHRLGAPVLEIIAQHHGTSLVRGPFARAIESFGHVERAEFLYGGPRPISKEAALVMLADVVETATQPLAAEPGLTRGDIEEVVHRVINEVVEEGQLGDCELTLREVGLLVACFTRELEERLIRRVKPPTLSSLPALTGPQVVRAPGGEPN
ncbi:MAG: HDIG domain-containing protein [Deltaproteobacteria bacterium]|nr:HDIG domain-containing protein [Deltaproteobacteria bacterium]